MIRKKIPCYGYTKNSKSTSNLSHISNQYLIADSKNVCHVSGLAPTVYESIKVDKNGISMVGIPQPINVFVSAVNLDKLTMSCTSYLIALLILMRGKISPITKAEAKMNMGKSLNKVIWAGY